MTVATTILEQLGGKRFQVMTGAKQFVGSDYSLQFGIPKSQGINKIVVRLTNLDLYRVTFYNIRGINVKVIRTVDSIDASQLREVFTNVTGLEISLGTMGR